VCVGGDGMRAIWQIQQFPLNPTPTSQEGIQNSLHPFSPLVLPGKGGGKRTGRNRWVLMVPFTLSSPESSWTDSRIGGFWEGSRSHIYTLFGVPCFTVLSSSQGADPGLAWVWKGSYCCFRSSQEGRKRPRALPDGHTPPAWPPAAQWLTAQAILRYWARGNPGLSGREGTEKEGYPPPYSLAPNLGVPSLKTPALVASCSAWSVNWVFSHCAERKLQTHKAQKVKPCRLQASVGASSLNSKLEARQLLRISRWGWLRGKGFSFN
jgi:hypothetical protein